MELLNQRRKPDTGGTFLSQIFFLRMEVENPMGALKIVLITVSLVSLISCKFGTQRSASEVTRANAPGPKSVLQTKEQELQTNKVDAAKMQQLSLKQADQSQSAAEAYDRKIIKDGEFTLEVVSPMETQRRVTSIAESHGGFVVASESKQRQSSDPTQRALDITVVMRVP